MKADSAFRTITEVADDLKLPAHVLRFWETKFKQIEPLKRGGGRRYYRPEDIALVTRIRDLLHTQGYTIKGVQQLLQKESKAVANAATTQFLMEKKEADPDNLVPFLREVRDELQMLVKQLRAIPLALQDY
jgi:DNA-binding transcriptional MerR regulator